MSKHRRDAVTQEIQSGKQREGCHICHSRRTHFFLN